MECLLDFRTIDRMAFCLSGAAPSLSMHDALPAFIQHTTMRQAEQSFPSGS
jgi:hypothetical protein